MLFLNTLPPMFLAGTLLTTIDENNPFQLSLQRNICYWYAYSESGKGRSFKINIPRHYLEDIAAADVHMPAQRQPGQETILLVEDKESLLDITTAMLRELGYNVLAADGLQAALRLAEAYDVSPPVW